MVNSDVIEATEIARARLVRASARHRRGNKKHKTITLKSPLLAPAPGSDPRARRRPRRPNPRQEAAA